MAALANKLDEKGHPDLADKFDGMTKSAGLFGGLAKLPFKTLGLGLRGLGSGLKFLGHHPYLTTGAGLGALTKLKIGRAHV